MKIKKFRKVKGYIEGYYGKILNWNERAEILKSLSENKMNFYFYCPKEDLYHRFNWKKEYPDVWKKKFSQFCNLANRRKINTIAGLSPGLDFNFKLFNENNLNEFQMLIKKFSQFNNLGANCLGLLLDDLPNNFKDYCSEKDEGIIHAKLTNELYNKFKLPFFVVPRIYAEELNDQNRKYLENFLNVIDKNIHIFFCGKFIVSKVFKTNNIFIKRKIVENKIIYWDNFYANDYCPKRLIIGPWKNINLIEKSMINGTGQIHTDKLILEIVHKNSQKNNKILNWKKALVKNKVPIEFFKISKNFLSPNFTSDKKIKKIKFDKKFYDYIDTLLWDWKTDLSREWYPYLLNYKHDLQIFNKELSFNRILKTQNTPLQEKLTE